MSEESWATLLENYDAVRAQNRSPNTKSANPDQFIAVNLKQQLNSLISELLDDGIISRNKSELSNDEITVRDLEIELNGP
ncbi:MAG: hypothetical protein U5J63_11310 [Fodinibius sp.]|nr:hypothetical protein [Fodinibius sp.]